jgi:hypothetical protein
MKTPQVTSLASVRFALIKSSTKVCLCLDLSSSVLARRIEEGGTVAKIGGVPATTWIRPRLLVTRNCDPSNAWAAIAPRQTIIRECTTSISASSHGRQAFTSRRFGFSCGRRLPRGSHLKCLTAFVTYAASRSNPASSIQAVRSFPAGPTNGSLALSSWSPGCSPTNRMLASIGPLPNTVCVAFQNKSHPRQSNAASFSDTRSRRCGRKAEAVGFDA